VCDTVAVVPENGPVWFAKNSDREPNEIQFIECDEGDAAQTAPTGWPVEPPSERMLLSRPGWMWGAEIGVNEHGVAIGNEAVFTKLPVPKQGRTGMEFLRIALGVCRTADEALDLLIDFTERFPQGGRMGHRNRSFRYNSSFIVADPSTGWVLETVGQLWAAKRIRGVATISNALTIEDDFDRIHTGAYEVARKRGWAKSAGSFRFASSFSDPWISKAAGAAQRRACTAASLSSPAELRVEDFIATLTDHGGVDPMRGVRGVSPCAHASWSPARHAQQTTSSLIARLDPRQPTIWATGTSAPCLSVFKPVPMRPDLFPLHPVEDRRYEAKRLWWAHERLHRACLQDFAKRPAAFADERDRFQRECLAPDAEPMHAWKTHRDLVDRWYEAALDVRRAAIPRPGAAYWSHLSRAAAMS
jgi:dipeptidase